MKVLVTGANGFIGPHLIDALQEFEVEVVGLVRKESNLNSLRLKNVKLVYGDVTDKNSLRAAFDGTDVVFHLAGKVSLKNKDRQQLEQTNVVGTRNIVELCKELKVRKLIHTSSV